MATKRIFCKRYVCLEVQVLVLFEKFSNLLLFFFPRKLRVGATMVSKIQGRPSQKMCIVGVSRMTTTGKHIMVMDYADLGDLTTFLRKNPDLSWSRKLQILLKLAKSLDDFHGTGMIHRDIHGGNVL